MPKKILIVEDEENILELLLVIFDDYKNYKVSYVRDGEEALRLVRVDNPDVILLDINLPKLNGYEVCKSIKSDSAISHIKILMLSGMAQEYNWQRGQEVGVDGFITKPFSKKELMEKIEDLLRSN